MLTIWALGASPETIQLQYEREDKRQRPAFSPNMTLIEALHDKKAFIKQMYRDENYSSFLAFFQQEIDQKGVPIVLNEYLFSGDELAESLLLSDVCRTCSPYHSSWVWA